MAAFIDLGRGGDVTKNSEHLISRKGRSLYERLVSLSLAYTPLSCMQPIEVAVPRIENGTPFDLGHIQPWLKSPREDSGSRQDGCLSSWSAFYRYHTRRVVRKVLADMAKKRD